MTFELSSPRAKRAGPKGLRAESARAFTGRRNSYSAQCAVCKVYFSAQPNKLKPILNFQKYYPI